MALRGGRRPQRAKAYCRRMELMGVAANALRGPPVGDTRTELGRRTPWWGENFGTAGPTGLLHAWEGHHV